MRKVFLIITLLSVTVLTANAQSDVAKKAFNKTLTSYFDTKNALAKDDLSLASSSAKNLITSLESFPIQSFTPAQRTIWTAQAEIIKTEAIALIAQKDLKAQRKSFWPVSSAMLKLTKELNLNSSDIYVQYCPMAKKSWLNEVTAVQNPFYGSMMYDCGSVTETIAKK